MEVIVDQLQSSSPVGRYEGIGSWALKPCKDSRLKQRALF